jgi:hypothetical protein
MSPSEEKKAGRHDATGGHQSGTMKGRSTIEGRDGAFGAYIARPKTLLAPADTRTRPVR